RASQLRALLRHTSHLEAVIMKNKLRFMDGSCPKPDQFDPTYEPWICLNNLVLFWLMNSIIPTISQSLMYTDNASQAWDDLKARSGFMGGIRVVSPCPLIVCVMPSKMPRSLKKKTWFSHFSLA
ncbi:hypothetical protein L195_g033289, partial [Trifolium pratense]